jgi:hypothetical protein
MKEHKVEDLNQLYLDGDSCDQELFAEQRSNILLVMGEHYMKRGSKFWNRIRNAKDINEEQKLRLTKNHIGRIAKNYVNNITMYAPGVAISPKNESELQDQKSAELHSAVWQDYKVRHNLNAQSNMWAKDFIEIGESFVKIFWDPSGGKFQGYKQEVDEMGQPVFDETGAMKASKDPVFSGDIVIERHFAFNILRAKEAKSFDDSKVVIIRKMVSVEELKCKYKDDPEKLKFIETSSDETYKVFDGSRGAYVESKDELMLKEYYFRPCYDYPMGFFYIATTAGILEKGELPLGIFPIKRAGFDEAATSPRARAIIKQLRPYQAEVNRTASKMAEHQITLGDDKILIQSGTTLSPGATLPGVRSYKYTGMTPTILAGRAGDQYLGYMQAQIKEMYDVAEMQLDSETLPAQLDPYAMLFQSMRQKKKFSIYAMKFENFLIEICKTVLELAKAYYDDNDADLSSWAP